MGSHPFDIGAEYGMYTADVTRTIPISGKFTDRQRDIYEIVLAANQAGIAMVAPGVSMNAINAKVNDILMQGLVKVGLIETVDRSELRKYYYHGLGHSLGREVHSNAVNLDGWETHDTRQVIPGIAITFEPGIYLPDFGVRSEIDVYVTADGPRITTEVQREVVLIRP